jgi:hypothetical protein
VNGDCRFGCAPGAKGGASTTRLTPIHKKTRLTAPTRRKRAAPVVRHDGRQPLCREPRWLPGGVRSGCGWISAKASRGRSSRVGVSRRVIGTVALFAATALLGCGSPTADAVPTASGCTGQQALPTTAAANAGTPSLDAGRVSLGTLSAGESFSVPIGAEVTVDLAPTANRWPSPILSRDGVLTLTSAVADCSLTLHLVFIAIGPGDVDIQEVACPPDGAKSACASWIVHLHVQKS